jgi:hypothetical protein
MVPGRRRREALGRLGFHRSFRCEASLFQSWPLSLYILLNDPSRCSVWTVLQRDREVVQDLAGRPQKARAGHQELQDGSSTLSLSSLPSLSQADVPLYTLCTAVGKVLDAGAFYQSILFLSQSSLPSQPLYLSIALLFACLPLLYAMSCCPSDPKKERKELLTSIRPSANVPRHPSSFLFLLLAGLFAGHVDSASLCSSAAPPSTTSLLHNPPSRQLETSSARISLVLLRNLSFPSYDHRRCIGSVHPPRSQTRSSLLLFHRSASHQQGRGRCDQDVWSS